MKVVYRNPAIGLKSAQCFMSIDPLAGKYPNMSPYNYCAGNPVKFIDVDGKYIDLSKLSSSQLEEYNATIKFLSTSKLFSSYYKQLQTSETVYTILGGTADHGTGEVGGYFDSGTNEIAVGSSMQGYVVAQELFHAYQKDGGFYNNKSPKPYSTIETEGDIMAVYVMIEAGGGFPSFGD